MKDGAAQKSHPGCSPNDKKLTPALTEKVLEVDPDERVTLPVALANTRAKKLLAGQR